MALYYGRVGHTFIRAIMVTVGISVRDHWINGAQEIAMKGRPWSSRSFNSNRWRCFIHIGFGDKYVLPGYTSDITYFCTYLDTAPILLKATFSISRELRSEQNLRSC